MPKESELWTPRRSKLKKAVERTADGIAERNSLKEHLKEKGMKKKMGCKAHWGFQHRSNLEVVRI